MIACVDFVPPRRRALRRVRARARAWGAAVTTLSLTLALGYLAVVARDPGDSGAVASELERARTALERETAARAELDGRIGVAEADLALARVIGRHPDWSVLLNLLARERGQDVVLDRVWLQPADRPFESTQGSRPAAPNASTPRPASSADGFHVRVSGQARSQAGATQFVLRLERLRLFDAVRLIETKPANIPGRDFVAFQIECAIGAAPAPQPATSQAAKGGGT